MVFSVVTVCYWVHFCCIKERVCSFYLDHMKSLTRYALNMVTSYCWGGRCPFPSLPLLLLVGKVAFSLWSHAVARVMDHFSGLISHILCHSLAPDDGEPTAPAYNLMISHPINRKARNSVEKSWCNILVKLSLLSVAV